MAEQAREKNPLESAPFADTLTRALTHAHTQFARTKRIFFSCWFRWVQQIWTTSKKQFKTENREKSCEKNTPDGAIKGDANGKIVLRTMRMVRNWIYRSVTVWQSLFPAFDSCRCWIRVCECKWNRTTCAVKNHMRSVFPSILNVAK